jgi:hypothetical protein
VIRRLRGLTATTPGRYRAWSIVVVAALLATAVAGYVAARQLADATDRLEANTGPVLVATQDLVASLSEADAAATAAFLSGAPEDREQRGVYEDALSRAARQLEEVSSLIGDDEATHAVLADISVQLARYAGLVEAARARNLDGTPGAEQDLVAAVELLAGTISQDAESLTEATDARLDDDDADRTLVVLIAVALALAAAVLLIGAHQEVARRSRRRLNPALLAATVLVVAAAGLLLRGHLGAQGAIDDARRDGYESIALTAEVQVLGQRARADETVALIVDDAGRRAAADARAAELADADITDEDVDRARGGRDVDFDGLLTEVAQRADDDRERAAAAELLTRWQRYVDTVDDLRAAGPVPARAIAVAEGSSTFNGFNISVESVLGDNRSQFLDGLSDAEDRTAGLTAATVLLPLLAAAAALGGLQLRINEYR